MKKVISLAGILFFITSAIASPVESNVLSGVPEYEWYRGCTPTAAAMIFGYWGTKYPPLWGGMPPMTNNLLLPDDPANRYIEAVALTLKTSPDGNTYISKVPKGMRKFAKAQGFYFKSKNVAPSYEVVKAEIDAGRPMHVAIQLVQGFYAFGHSVVAYGYKTDDEGNQWMAVRDTWLDGDSNGYGSLKAHVDENGVEWFLFATEPYARYKILNVAYLRPPDPIKNRKKWLKMQALLEGYYAQLGLDYTGGISSFDTISSSGQDEPINFLGGMTGLAGSSKLYSTEGISGENNFNSESGSVPVPEPSGIFYIVAAFGGALIRRRRKI